MKLGLESNPPKKLRSYTGSLRIRQFDFSKLSQTTKPRTTKALDFRAFCGVANARFQFYTHVERLAAVLERVVSGEIKRLMVFMPPRHGKSEEVSRLFAAYYLLCHPDKWVGLNSYAAELAETLSRSARDNYLKAGGPISRASSAVNHWETGQGGGMWAAGVGGPITGKGFHLGIVDDPLKNAEEAASETIRNKHKEWWQSTFYTRAEPDAAIIVIQTRWHEDDLSGWLLSQEDSDEPERWHIVCFEALKADGGKWPETCTLEDDWRKEGDALCPERYNAKRLNAIRAVAGSYFFGALYQQVPTSPTGTIFQKAWFTRTKPQEVPERAHFGAVVQGWDTAYEEGKENDYSACVTIGAWRNVYVVLDVWRGKVEYPALVRQMKAQADKWQPSTIVVEDKASGKSAVQTIRSETALPIVAVPANKDKVARANLVTGTCEAGRVWIPQGAAGDMLLDELLRFPTGKHDDMTDAFVHGLHKITTGRAARATSREY
jgi:predicted phage terminase large subunit-like protein